MPLPDPEIGMPGLVPLTPCSALKHSTPWRVFILLRPTSLVIRQKSDASCRFVTPALLHHFMHCLLTQTATILRPEWDLRHYVILWQIFCGPLSPTMPTFLYAECLSKWCKHVQTSQQVVGEQCKSRQPAHLKLTSLQRPYPRRFFQYLLISRCAPGCIHSYHGDLRASNSRHRTSCMTSKIWIGQLTKTTKLLRSCVTDQVLSGINQTWNYIEVHSVRPSSAITWEMLCLANYLNHALLTA